ncbi:MAG TPA: hypothetical protein VK158_00580 [Acidobacteriota bacterium]|nr:hypothetical protein [Acidobacteriota bacterium]
MKYAYMTFCITILFILSSCTQTPVQNDADVPEVQEDARVGVMETEAPAQVVIQQNSNLFNTVLLPSDFSVPTYPAGYQGNITPLFVSETMYSRAQRYGFEDGYTVVYTDQWNPRTEDFNFRFSEQVYDFPSAQVAKDALTDLNHSLFTGKYDELDETYTYTYDQTATTRVEDVRRFRKDFVDVMYLAQVDDKLVYFQCVYPLENFSHDYYKDVINLAVSRIQQPLKNQKSYGLLSEEEHSKNFIQEQSNENFTVKLNSIQMKSVDNGSGDVGKIIFTVNNKKTYPFYPAFSYYVQKIDISQEKSDRLSGQVYPKFTYYYGTLFDTGEQRSVFFTDQTSVIFEENGSALIRLQILDQTRGETTYPLAMFNFTVNLKDYVNQTNT